MISAVFLADIADFRAVAVSVEVVSFFSGSPNFAARFASTSSLIPSGAASMVAGLAFGCTLGAVGVDAPFAGVDLFGADLGSKDIPNRSARTFRACWSGVRFEDSADIFAGVAIGWMDILSEV